MNTPSDNPRMPVATLPSSPAPPSPTPVLSLNTTLLYRLRVTMWLRWQMFSTLVRKHGCLVSFLLFGLFIILLCLLEAGFPGGMLIEDDLRPYTSAWAWAWVGIITAMIVTSGRKVSNEAGQLELDHLFSMPISTSHAYTILALDSLYNLLPLYVLMVLFMLPFVVSASAFWLSLIFCTAYLLVLTVWTLIIRVVANSAATEGNTLARQISIWLPIFAFYLFFGAQCTQSYDEASPTTPLLAHFQTLVYSITHYTFPGASAELCMVANGASYANAWLWSAILAINFIALLFLAYKVLCPAMLEIEPFRHAQEQAAVEMPEAPVVQHDQKPAEDMPVLMSWTRRFNDNRLTEMITARFGNEATLTVGMALVLLLVFVVRIFMLKGETSFEWSLVTGIIGSILLFVLPLVEVSYRNPLSINSMQSPAPRLTILLHIVLWLGTRALPSILILGFLVTPWTGNSFFGITCLLLIAWCIYLANVVNAAAVIALAGPQWPPQGRSSGMTTVTVSAWLALLYMLLLQIPLIPLYMLMFTRFNAESGAALPPNPLPMIAAIAGTILYFYYGTRFVAKYLEDTEMWYTEAYLYRRE